MACSCGLNLTTSTALNEGILDLRQLDSYLGLVGDPTPAPDPVDHDCLNANDTLRHDTWLEDFSTMADLDRAVPTLSPENNHFFIDQSSTEPWLRMPTTSPHGAPCHDPRPVDVTEPKEPPQPAKRTSTPSGCKKRRANKKTCYGIQRPSRQGYVAHQTCQSQGKS